RAQPDASTTRPQAEDRVVRISRDGTPEILTPARVPAGGPPVIAYPMDPVSKTVRDGSRLNQIMLVRLEPGELVDETRRRAAHGVVAYSAVCTHTGCDIWDWNASAKTVKCPCHFSS